MLEEQIRSEMEVTEEQWYYCDDENEVQGPFPASHMSRGILIIWMMMFECYVWGGARPVGKHWGKVCPLGPFPSPTLAAVHVLAQA